MAGIPSSRSASTRSATESWPRPPSTTMSEGGSANLPGRRRCLVPLSWGPLELELAVVGPLWEPVCEHHRRPDLVGRPQVGYVVCLDPEWGHGQTEDVSQLGQCSGPRGEVRGPPELVADEGVFGVVI